MKAARKYQCVGGPYDGDSPPWADGRYEIRYPRLPHLTASMRDFDVANATPEVDRYLLTELTDGRVVYLHESLR